jgi:hypothetical protein
MNEKRKEKKRKEKKRTHTHNKNKRRRSVIPTVPNTPIIIRSNKNNIYQYTVIKSKAIPVTGLGGPYRCETSRLPHFLDFQLTDGSEVVSLRVTPSNKQKSAGESREV